MIIRQTDKTTVDGLPIVQIKIGEEWKSFYQDDKNDTLVEYDETISNISFSFEEIEEEKTTIIREETKKVLRLISKDRVLGFHEYFNPKTQESLKAIVIWKKRSDKWLPSLSKGISGLNNNDINIIKEGILTTGW